MTARINHVAVWLLVFAQQAVGFIWYSSALFGDSWLTLQGKTRADIDPNDPVPFVTAILAAIAVTYFIAWLLDRLRIPSARAAIGLALVMWVCVSFGEIATHYAFLGLKPRLLLIDMGKSLVNLVLVATVLGLWRARGTST
jgi:hypothetical protein